MSRLQSIRLSLLAGSSLIAAGLMLAPGAALAQTCSPGTTPVANPGPDTYNCSAGTFPSGITYSSDGALTVNMVANGAVVNSTVTANGVTLTGNGADSVTFDSDIGSLTGGTTTAGPVIDIATGGGAITVSTGAVTGSGATITHGIRARSTGGGAISLSAAGSVSATNSTSGDTAIEAVSTGGNGSVSVQMLPMANGSFGSVSGRLYGIRAQASGSGNLTISARSTSVASGGVAAIDATTGSGTMTITTAGTVNGGNATALRTNAGGNATITVNGFLTTNNAAARTMDLTVGAGTTTTVVNNGTIQQSAPGNTVHSYGRQAIRASGAGNLVLDSAGTLFGRVDLSGLTGSASIAIGSTADWRTNGVSTFSAGADTLAIEAGGVIYIRGALPGIGSIPDGGLPTLFDFGGGIDAFNNAGILVVGDDGPTLSFGLIGPTIFTLAGLEAFNNSGLIILGADVGPDGMLGGDVGGTPDDEISDGVMDDVLRMTGGTFTGSGSSRIALDAMLSGAQTNCVDRDANDQLAAADCLDLRGASTAGSTLLTVNDTGLTLRGANSSIVIVDVSGAGTSAAGHFALATDSTNYSAHGGGIIDKGDFFYALLYDPTAQQHKLVGLPKGALQFAGMAPVVQGVWRTAGEAIFDRQVDRRSGVDAGAGGGVWLRVTGEQAERDLVQTAGAFGTTFEFDHSYEQDTVAVNAGVDLLWADGQDSSYALGLTVGYARSDLTYRETPDEVEFSGMTGGLYANYGVGGFFLDAAVTGVGMSMDVAMPSLNIFPAGSLVTTNAWGLGGRAELGWRFPLSEGLVIEPLASAAYVRTSFEDADIRVSGDPVAQGNVIVFEDAESLRGGVGARLGLTSAYGGMNVSANLTGRVWNEFEGESGIVVRNAGPDLPLMGEFSGAFSDIAASVSLSDDAGLLAGFLQAGGKWGDDYRSTTVSGGLRYRW